MKARLLTIAAALLLTAGALSAQTIGKDARYCNPLPMEIGQGSASGDVSVFQWEGKYYMFCTGGGAWVSEDMLNWDYHYVEGVPVAPDVRPYNGKFYMTGNSSNVWVADNPLGPYKVLGQWKNLPDLEHGWSQGFDPHIYVDEKNQPYLFWPGMAISGIYSVKLNKDDITQFEGPVTHHFSFNPNHIWERQGEHNEYPDVAWIEGPWIYKHNGTYYLQYSASGTQWRTYAEGYYKADKVEGPYVYADNNPLLRRTDGIVTGPAHGSMVTGPDGKIWQFYTVVLRSGGRRIGMDRVIVDENGNLTCDVTDTPQWAPGVIKDETRGDSGSIIISVGKTTMSTGEGFPGAAKIATSEKPGRGPEYALDDNTATWWEPADDDPQPSLMISLSPAVDRDRVQTFAVDGARILFGGGAGRGSRGGSSVLPVYKYKMEVSMDGKEWQTVVDQSANATPRNVVFDEFEPVEARYVKLTMLDWPKTGNFSILDFTVFGKATGWSPSQIPVPTPITY
ncbi:MAG: family 43 glycosylhydrolase [Bacteroidia bacterium]|nr:family 43 glycosylhydrolase [Bacteroidia bacterium]